MSSVSIQSVDLAKAAAMSTRIVIATLLEKSSFRFPGSKEHAPQPEGSGLSFFRIRVEKLLKGSELFEGDELRVFNSRDWFRHKNAEDIKDGVISYADFRYSGGLAPEQIETGMRLLFFLSADGWPPGFPPGTVFMGIGGAHDRADREQDVLTAIEEGLLCEFGQQIRLAGKDRIRFPDGLDIRFRGQSHKHSQVGGPYKEWIALDLSKDGQKGELALAHCTDRDGEETWDAKTWRGYSIEVKAMAPGEGWIFVRKLGDAEAPSA